MSGFTTEEVTDALMLMTGATTPEKLAKDRQQRKEQLAWLRASLEHDGYPQWLVTMVVQNWQHQHT